MKLTIVTPTFNRQEFLDETIRSVVTQSGDFDLEYIIQDGGSNRRLLESLDKWKIKLASPDFKPACRSLNFRYFVESDSGMYDAINKGFAQGNGDLMAWLNSDDYYFPNALAAVSQAFEQHPSVDWMIGQATSFNRDGSAIGSGYDPRAYSTDFIRRGYYRGDIRGFNWLSQDSMFWRRSLWEEAGPLDTSLSLASDFRLWQAFAEKADLVRINTLIGGYRSHGDQLTTDPDAYPQELGEAPRLSLRLKGLIYVSRRASGLCPLLFSRPLRALAQLIYGVPSGALYGKALTWDASLSKWTLDSRSILP